MYRTSVIIKYTFLEVIVQPIYSLLMSIGAGILVIFALLPFFTLGEDTKMYKSVGLDVVMLLVLLATLFATSKSIFDEIEDRTMMTLMSKPVRRWEVMIGKYFGILLAAGMGVAILGSILMICTWMRAPGDSMLRTATINDLELRQIFELRYMNVYGLVPSLLLLWMEIAVLAAISVALSTRFSLVVNLPAVIFLYIAGNLLRFVFPIYGVNSPLAHRSDLVKGIVWAGSLVLPYLQTFDLRELTVLSTIKLPNTTYALDVKAVPVNVIWGYVATAALYCICYSTFALSAGMWLFQTRELGGGEG
jgi:ABC-type transport system involved in multi-copper enzyme maturation permease subunit